MVFFFPATSWLCICHNTLLHLNFANQSRLNQIHESLFAKKRSSASVTKTRTNCEKGCKEHSQSELEDEKDTAASSRKEKSVGFLTLNSIMYPRSSDLCNFATCLANCSTGIGGQSSAGTARTFFLLPETQKETNQFKRQLSLWFQSSCGGGVAKFWSKCGQAVVWWLLHATETDISSRLAFASMAYV